MSRMVVSSSLEQLVDMGFEKELARSALETHGENIERACIALLGSEADVANSPERQVVEASISQYDVENGRSACTCICLEASLLLLEHLGNGKWGGSSDDVANVVRVGAITYEALIGAGTLTVEHTSVTELLAAVARYRDVLSPATARECHQGLLGPNTTFPDIFEAIKSERRHKSRPVAVVITKPPETVVAFLPPETEVNSRGTGSGTRGSLTRREWLLFDSHPRPQLGVMGASVRRFEQESALVSALVQIFPALDVEADNVMASMYNMVDCTPLVFTKHDG